MSPERWEKIKDIFDDLAESDQFRRKQVLSALEDPEIRQEVERLLASYAAVGSRPFPIFRSPLSPARLVQDIFRLRAFEPGAVLLDRFEIRTFLGAGGMGEVYEAFDRSLGELVAVKTIRPSLLADVEIVQRFRWEVQRARRVSHPNVCRVHELFSFPAEDGRELPFMTMELLPGPTLFDRVSEAPLSPGERLALAVQICRGLQAAHDAGLIHRDLKSANVILTGEGEGSPRAVITDFGLARLIATPDTSRGSYHSYGVPGTTQYLAPELIDGIGSTRKSDIYALGVILFRMAVRRYPFSDDPDLAAARAERMHPPDPRTFDPDLDATWAEVINECLQPAPAARPTRPDEIAVRLQEKEVAPPGLSRLSRRHLITGGASAAAIAAGLAAVWRYRATAPPPLLQIRPFSSTKADVSPAKAVTNLFRLTLMSSPRVRLAGRPQQGGGDIRADWLLAGEILPRGSGYTIRATVTKAGSGVPLHTAEAAAKHTGELARAVHLASMDLRLLPPAATASIRVANLPLEDLDSLNPEALDDMTGALTEYSSGNLDLALALLERATSKDPEFALAYVYRAIILSSMRRDHLALEPASRAVQLRARLSPRVRPHAQAVYHFLCGDYGSALAKYSEVARLYPTEAPLQRHLGQMYTILARPDEALRHVRQAVDLDPENPQSLMMLVSAYEDAGQSEAAARVLQKARTVIPDSVFLSIATGYSALLRDRWEEAFEAYDKVAVKADLEAFARSFQVRALVLAGRLGEAVNRLELRLGVIIQEADRPNEDLYRYWLGQLALLNGYNDAALRQAAVLVSREPIPPSLFPLRGAAEIASGAGDVAICNEVVRKVQSIGGTHPSRRCTGILHQCLALQAAAQGRVEHAAHLMEQAEEYWKDIAIWWTAAELLRTLGKAEAALSRYREIIARRQTAIRFECLLNWILANGRAGECSEMLGQRAQAAQFYDRLLFHWGSQKQLAFVQRCIDARAKIPPSQGGSTA